MLYVYTKWKERIQKSVPEICSFLDYLHYQNYELCWHQLFMWVHHQKDPLTGGQESICIQCMCGCSYVFICIHIYLSISVSLYLYIHICLNLEKNETKIRTAVMANMKSKLMDKIFLYFNPCQIRGEMHLQIIGWQFLFKFLLQGQLFLLTSFWMLGFIYAAQHSMMNAKVKCLGEINCQTEFRHYSFYDVKKVRTVTPRHL